MIISIRKKPVTVQAILWDGLDFDEVREFCKPEYCTINQHGILDVYNTSDTQWIRINQGHYIIKGIKGELYPCAPDVLHETYEIL